MVVPHLSLREDQGRPRLGFGSGILHQEVQRLAALGGNGPAEARELRLGRAQV